MSGKKSRWKGKNDRSGVLGEADVLTFKLHFSSIAADNKLWASCPIPIDNQQVQDAVDHSVTLQMACKQLEAWLNWLCCATEEDSDVCLAFSPELTKAQRAAVHGLVQQHHSARLETVSSGVGQDRIISVYRKGQAPRLVSEELKAHALQLYKFARSQVLCMEMSVDEMTERLANSNLTDEMREAQELFTQYVSALDRVLTAVAMDDAEAIQVVAAAHQDIITDGVVHPTSGCLPLQEAARSGKLQAIRALVAAGAPLEAQDAREQTALQVAKLSEQTDAEAVLCQLGAHDPDAHTFPLTAAAAQLGMQQVAPQM